MLSFDDYLSDKVGIGKGQLLIFVLLSLIQFINGFQELFAAILIQLLGQEWQLLAYQQGILTFIYFFGALFGNIILSLFADSIGRRNIVIATQILSIITIGINSFITTYYQAFIVFFSYGIIFGIAYPICFVLAGEFVPLDIRGRYLVMLQLIFLIGIIYLILQYTIFFNFTNQDNWRQMLRINIFLPIITTIGSIFFLEESPRYHLMKANYQVAFQILDSLGKMNNIEYHKITDEEKMAMIEWQEEMFKLNHNQVQLKDLFHENVLKLTLFILGIFWIFNILSCAIIIVTPFLAGETEGQFKGMLFAYSMEIPAIFIALLLFDNQIYGGRIKVIFYGLFILLVGQCLLVYYQYSYITIGMILLRVSFRLIWSGLNALPTESYNTQLRSLGVGIAHGTGKIPGSLASIFVIPLFYESPFLPFYFGIAFTLILILLVWNYPIDTTQQPLDSHNREFSQNRIENDRNNDKGITKLNKQD